MSKRPHPPSSPGKQKKRAKKPKNQNEPVRRSDTSGDKVDPFLIAPAVSATKHQTTTTAISRSPLQAQLQNRATVPLGTARKAGGTPVFNVPNTVDDIASGIAASASARSRAASVPKLQSSKHAKATKTVARKLSQKNAPRPLQPAADPSVCCIVALIISHLLEMIKPDHRPGSFVYVGPPKDLGLPSSFSKSGFWYYLLLKFAWFSLDYNWITRSSDKMLPPIFFQLFFYLALASWGMEGCVRSGFAKTGKEQHFRNTGRAVRDDTDKCSKESSTVEHILLYYMTQAWKEYGDIPHPAPWIDKHVRQSLEDRIGDDVRDLLTRAPSEPLAYAVGLLLSYNEKYPNGLPKAVLIDKDFRALSLCRVKDTAESRIQLSRMFPVRPRS